MMPPIFVRPPLMPAARRFQRTVDAASRRFHATMLPWRFLDISAAQSRAAAAPARICCRRGRRDERPISRMISLFAISRYRVPQDGRRWTMVPGTDAAHTTFIYSFTPLLPTSD